MKIIKKKAVINIAKDMYPKRKERENQKENNQDNQVTKTNINWYTSI